MISKLPMQAQLIDEVSNDLEPLITRLWEDLFGFSPIGLQDDFFQLGGNSLHAARLVAKIRALTGRDLPLESFLYAPTIEQLALLMRAGNTISSSTLVTLREGRRERPLFIAHSLSGTMLELWALAREMDCHCAVYWNTGPRTSRGRSAEFSRGGYGRGLHHANPLGSAPWTIRSGRVFYGRTDRV